MHRRRWLAAGVLGLLPLSWLARRAWVSPEIEFLPPSLQADWIVHPDPPIAWHSRPTCPDVRFLRRFDVREVPGSLTIAVRAMRRFVLAINGTHLDRGPTSSWKRRCSFDLAPYLRAGENCLAIDVGGDEGPPALLVEGPPELRTDRRWQVALGPDFADPQPAARAERDERLSAAVPSVLRRVLPTGAFVLLLGAWLGWSLAVFLAALGKRGSRSPAARPIGSWPRALAALIVALVIAIDLHNALTYPYARGFDAGGHVAYVRQVAHAASIPTATDGWEMFQPPLYYVVAAPFYSLLGGERAEPRSLRALQVLGVAVPLVLLIFTWRLLECTAPRAHAARILALGLAGLVPVGLYMSPMVTNEGFASALIALGLWLVARHAFERPLRRRGAIAIGVACGLAMLSRYTGIFLFAGVCVLLLFRVLRERSQWRWSAWLVATALAIALPCYARNAARFGNPFVGNWDAASGFHYEQPPGYHTARYFATFGAALLEDPIRLAFRSFWDGHYSSFWADPQYRFLNPFDHPTQLLGGIVLWLALPPTLIVLAGFARTILELLRREWDHVDLVLVCFSFFLFVALIAFSMMCPFVSTVNAHLFLALLPAIAVFAARGLEAACARLGRLRWLLHGNLAALWSVTVVLFWYRW